MARNFTSAGELSTNTNWTLGATPLSMACWFYSSDTTSVFYLQNALDVDISDSFLLRANAGNVEALTVAAGNVSTAVTTAGYSSGVWNHAAAVWTSATDRAAFLNGGSKGTEATSRTPSGIDRVGLAGRRTSGTGDVALAEIGVWDIALADADVARLAAGLSPLLVRPASLVACWPIRALSTEIDVVGGFGMAPAGSSSAFAHPRIVMPHSQYIPSRPAGNRRRRVIMSRAG